MSTLKRYEKYTREDIHDIFSPNTKFTRSAGYWGISGIIRIPDSINDFAFLVTFGTEQAGHKFKEGITENGVFTWQSQPSQTLSTPIIRKLIEHDEQINTIYLFLRTSKKEKYTYLGDLAYLSHDNEKENPVYFKWQILDFNENAAVKAVNGLEIDTFEVGNIHMDQQVEKHKLIESEIPSINKRTRTGKKTEVFRIQNIDFEKRGKENDTLGKAGEVEVLRLEKERLIAEGREDLAEKVVLTRDSIGNNAAFDISSFSSNGEELFIEVKTTEGNINTPFYISMKEVLYSINFSNQYKLYRLYNFDKSTGNGNYYVMEGELTEQLELEPLQFRGTVKKEGDILNVYWDRWKRKLDKK